MSLISEPEASGTARCRCEKMKIKKTCSHTRVYSRRIPERNSSYFVGTAHIATEHSVSLSARQIPAGARRAGEPGPQSTESPTDELNRVQCSSCRESCPWPCRDRVRSSPTVSGVARHDGAHAHATAPPQSAGAAAPLGPHSHAGRREQTQRDLSTQGYIQYIVLFLRSYMLDLRDT